MPDYISRRERQLARWMAAQENQNGARFAPWRDAKSGLLPLGRDPRLPRDLIEVPLRIDISILGSAGDPNALCRPVVQRSQRIE
jgi:hypothetical protein